MTDRLDGVDQTFEENEEATAKRFQEAANDTEDLKKELIGTTAVLKQRSIDIEQEIAVREEKLVMQMEKVLQSGEAIDSHIQEIREETAKLNEKQKQYLLVQLEAYDLKQVARERNQSEEVEKKLKTADHRSVMLFEDQKADFLRRF